MTKLLRGFARDFITGKKISPWVSSETVVHNDEPMNTILSRIMASAGVQGNVGEIFLWPLPSPPDDALVCDGSAVGREDYADLFAIIGVSFGDGDGSTTFNLPNIPPANGLYSCIRCKADPGAVIVWAHGVHQNQSAPSYGEISPLPIVTAASRPGLVVGNKFTAPGDGLYCLSIGRGQGNTASTIVTVVVRLYDSNGINYSRPKATEDTLTSTKGSFSYNGISHQVAMKSGDYMEVVFTFATTQSSIVGSSIGTQLAFEFTGIIPKQK